MRNQSLEIPKSVTFFPNGNVAAFDQNENQIGELQESLYSLYFKFLESKGIDPTKIGEIAIFINNTWRYLKPFKTEKGDWNYNITDF